MKSDALQPYVPGDVREPFSLQFVPLEPIACGQGSGAKQPIKGYSGTALTMRSGPGAPAKPMGFVIACPQVPWWMSPEYTAAVAEAKSGDIQLEDYTTEWFEKVIYLHKDDLDKAAQAPGGLAWTTAMAQLGPAFDSTQSDGCARAGARTPVYRAELGEDGLPAKLKFEGVFYSLVWEDPKAPPATPSTRVREISLAPLKSRAAFAATARHKKQLAESSRLAKEADPEGVKAKLRATHLGAVKKIGKR
jgi:hypothetical protein